MATTQFSGTESGKRAAIAALYAGSALIVAVGLAFGVYSFIYHVSYMVLNTDVPGYVFAAVAAFLGVRYFRSVQKMSRAMKGKAQQFSWKNFKISGNRTKKMEG